MICDSGFEIWDLLVAQLSKILIIIIGPGGLRAAHVVVDGSEAGHCFYLLFFGPGGLRAPPVVADEAKLAIFLSSSKPSAFHPLRGYSGS